MQNNWLCIHCGHEGMNPAWPSLEGAGEEDGEVYLVNGCKECIPANASKHAPKNDGDARGEEAASPE